MSSDKLPAQAERMKALEHESRAARRELKAVTDALEAAQAALAQRDYEFNILMTHMSDCVAVYRALDDGEDFEIVDFNRAAERVEQCRTADIVGRRVCDVFPGMATFGLLDVFKRVWRTGRSERFPLRLYQDNRIKGYRDNFVYKLPSGDIVALYSDETERKAHEETIRQTNQTLETAQKMARLAYWNYDAATDRVEWSSQMFTLLGLDAAQGVPGAQEQVDLVHPEDREKVFDSLARSLTDGESYAIVYRMYLPDRSIRWFSVQGHPQLDDNGHVLRVNGILLDVTEIKEAEMAKEALEAQLRQAQKLEAIGTITGGIAHDFNNILAIIMGNAELAVDTLPAKGEERKNLDEILKATLRARDIIRQLLSFSRKDYSRREPVDLAALIKESVHFIRATVPPEIEMKAKIQTRHPIILADAGQIHQVVLNLCTNAAHAMEASGGILEISIVDMVIDAEASKPSTELKPGNYVCLSVRDTGQGIDPECIDRIFDPYFTTKQVGKGSGLGLSVVHGIVQKHDAVIKVESVRNKGTVFTIHFPQIERAPASVRRVDQQPAKGSESILFVDDEPSLVDIGAKMLTRLGYQVTTSDNGQKALDLIRKSPQRFDLVISDMSMPRMSGEVLAQKIKQIRPGLPILLCTGFSKKMNPKKANDMGVYFTEKPLKQLTLASLLRKMLDA